MNNAPIRWLLVSGAAELLVSSGLGYAMLIPMQPWARGLRDRWPPARVLMSIHLDLVMLSLMQFAAAAGIHALPGAHDRLAAGLLVAAGWLNVTPYIWRAVGVNAFALAGGVLQRTAALISLAGTLALTTGWIVLLASWATR